MSRGVEGKPRVRRKARRSAASKVALNLPSDMWRSRPSRIAVDMKAEAITSALSRALLGGRHAQSMWVKAEQSNIRVTSAGCAMAEVMMAGRDRAAAITRFIFTPPLTNWGQTRPGHCRKSSHYAGGGYEAAIFPS